MSELREKIKNLIEKESDKGHFTVLNTNTNVDLIYQIIKNYEKTNDIKEISEDEELPKKAELIFIAAPTGAGKDCLVARFNHKNPEKKYIELNMDIFRQYFPAFIDSTEELTDKNFANKTNEFAYEIYATIQEILLQEFPGTNIIITGTLRETDWVEKTFERFKNDEKTNYTVKIACLAVPKKESAISVIGRYIGIVNTQKDRLEFYPGTARYTSMQYHDETFERFPINLKYFQDKFAQEPGKIIDEIEVHRRGKNVYELDEDTQVFSSSEDGSQSALDAVMKLRLKDYRVSYEEATSIIGRIKENMEYLKSQGTLREVVRDLAVILNYPEILKRLERMPVDENENQEEL